MRQKFGPEICTYNNFSDGAPVHANSKNSMWVMMMTLNCLPALIRFKNVILAGIWFGREEPIMPIFYKPFIQMINILADTGVNWRRAGG